MNELAQGLGPYPPDMESPHDYIDGKIICSVCSVSLPLTIELITGAKRTSGTKHVIFKPLFTFLFTSWHIVPLILYPKRQRTLEIFSFFQ